MPASTSDFVVSVSTSTYDITGSTAEALRAQMDALGPGGFDAYTSWFVRWTVPDMVSDAGCAPGEVKVSVLIVYNFPHWDPPADAPAALVDRWTAYTAALHNHEDGHKDIAIAAGQEVKRTLDALPAFPACDALQQAANTAGNRILDQHLQREAEYDRSTDHGATQGARFP